ncbi:MAG: response regulator transcription factor [Exiguobacterium marinum]|uniref:Response regulator transcription factor n=1 Tax=Exiguobacterium marinum TaxID=273528 RepID=A0ABY7X163_9BACL|nr:MULTISPECIES: response regulator transcription factor [Exiguobacterium]WDH75646.1 response regulator transcription factor [Exiguobacterium marinum]
MQPINVLIVDDHELVRRGLKLMFRTNERIRVVGEATEGSAAIQEALRTRPDVILLDITMPNGLDGFVTVKALAEEVPTVKVILLTMHDEEIYIKRALELGVPGYMSKNSDPSQLEEGIKHVFDGKRYYATSLNEDYIEKIVFQKNNHPLLTRRELEIVRLSTLGYSHNEIGEKLGISPKTVENHKARVMNKLQIKHRHELVQYALKNHLIEMEG